MVVPPGNHSRLESAPTGQQLAWWGVPNLTSCRNRRHQRQGGLRRKAHPEPLPSFADWKAPRAFHHNPDERHGLPRHYQCCDYAPLQSRPPCLRPSEDARKDGHIRGRSRWLVHNAGYQRVTGIRLRACGHQPMVRSKRLVGSPSRLPPPRPRGCGYPRPAARRGCK